MTVIESLEIKNFQRVSAVKIEPTNSLICLYGKNANGKSSVLDAIETTLGGFDGKVTKRPVKDGAGRADIRITLSDGTTFHRKFTAGSRDLIALKPDGEKIGQKTIDGFLSPLGVDAYAFIRKGAKGQLEDLLSIVNLPFVPAELAAQRKKLEDDRRLIGQQSKALGDPVVDPDLPVDEPSAGDLIARISEAEAANAEITANTSRLEGLNSQKAQIQAQMKALQTQLVAVIDKQTELKAWLEPREIQGTAALREELANVETQGAAVRANNAAREQVKRKDELRTQYEEHTAKIKALDETKAAGLAAAQMPIEGLTFDEDEVFYQGVPLSRASESEALIVSAAMIIATNPDVRTMTVRNGNVFDADSLQRFQDMLEAHDFQAFIELVSDAEDHEYRIVDGELA